MVTQEEAGYGGRRLDASTDALTRSWFDRLTMSGSSVFCKRPAPLTMSGSSAFCKRPAPLTLSLSKGERKKAAAPVAPGKRSREAKSGA